MESYTALAKIEADWNAHLKAEREKEKRMVDPLAAEKRTQAGDETKYWEFISKNFPDKFSSFIEFKHSRALRNKMKTLGIWDTYQEYCKKHCKFSNPDMQVSTILETNSEILKQVGKYSELQCCILPLMQFAIPTNDGAPWIFRTKKDTKKLSLLFTVLSDTTFFKKAMMDKAARAQAQRGGEDEKSKQPKKKQKAANGKALPKPPKAVKPVAVPLVSEAITIDSSVDPSGNGQEQQRKTFIVDDYVASVDFAVRSSGDKPEGGDVGRGWGSLGMKFSSSPFPSPLLHSTRVGLSALLRNAKE
eukprot:2190170-Pyramimonas_sp.AAC.1